MSRFHITGQRRVKHQWQDCLDSEAERFAVIEVKSNSTGNFRRPKVVTAWPTKAEAIAAHSALCRKGRRKGALNKELPCS